MQPKIDVRRRKQLKEMAGRKTAKGKELPVDDKSKVKGGDQAAKNSVCIHTGI